MPQNAEERMADCSCAWKSRLGGASQPGREPTHTFGRGDERFVAQISPRRGNIKPMRLRKLIGQKPGHRRFAVEPQRTVNGFACGAEPACRLPGDRPLNWRQ